MHPDGFGVSRRKITISTCGIVPGIVDLADNGPHVRLAVSLTAAEDALRSSLMPVNRSWNLASLKEALLYYQAKTGDRITLEAAIMGGENSVITSYSIHYTKLYERWGRPATGFHGITLTWALSGRIHAAIAAALSTPEFSPPMMAASSVMRSPVLAW